MPLLALWWALAGLSQLQLLLTRGNPRRPFPHLSEGVTVNLLPVGCCDAVQTPGSSWDTETPDPSEPRRAPGLLSLPAPTAVSPPWGFTSRSSYLPPRPSSRVMASVELSFYLWLHAELARPASVSMAWGTPQPLTPAADCAPTKDLCASRVHCSVREHTPQTHGVY